MLLPPPRTCLAACPLASAARSTETNPAQRTCPHHPPAAHRSSPSPRRPQRFGSCSELSLRSTRRGRACLRSVLRQNRDGRRAPRAHAMRYSSTCCTCMHVCMYIPQQYLHYFVASTVDACEHIFTAPRVQSSTPLTPRRRAKRTRTHRYTYAPYSYSRIPSLQPPNRANPHPHHPPPITQPDKHHAHAHPTHSPHPPRGQPVTPSPHPLHPSTPLSSAQNSTRCDQGQPSDERQGKQTNKQTTSTTCQLTPLPPQRLVRALA